METPKALQLDSYLALIPRGLQYAARESIKEQLTGYNTTVEFVGEAIISEDDEDAHAEHVTSLLRTQQENKGRKKNVDIEPCCCLPVGSSIFLDTNKKNVSLGYMDKTKPIVSCPGVLPGVVWLRILTSAPVEYIAKHLRVVGPLLALVNVWDGIDMAASQSLEEAIDSVKELVEKSTQYPFSEALSLWQSHVHSAWNLSKEELIITDDKMKGLVSMAFRLSMIRSDSENYLYSRQEFLSHIADIIVPPQYNRLEEPWKVDLTKYDLEIVLLMHSKALAVGLALRPYQHLGVKSFATGNIPPDVSPPVLPGEVLKKVIRLRPTTAHLLLNLAEVEPGDVVLDPTCGVGTIPVEACFHKARVCSLGGDLVLTPETLGPTASSYSKDAHKIKRVIDPLNAGCADLVAWDASFLPLRDASVDVVVSDLPFGQQCLSKSKLDALLPLFFSEIARVLRPGTGRIVLLCGNYVSVVRALHELNSSVSGKDSEQQGAEQEEAIVTPLDSIFPTNIGGLMAWVVVAKRGGGEPNIVANYRARVKKVTGKRERIEKCKEGNDSTSKSKRRSDFQS